MQSALAEVWTPFEPDVMDIAGRLDDGTAPMLAEDALLCIQSGSRRMVLDCSNLTYITACGLRAILTVAREMKAADGSLAICELQPQVEEIFQVTGFDGLIPVYKDRTEAIVALAG
jgi:stage II sporulation protein AA (anti-sigma F factor antagonist)